MEQIRDAAFKGLHAGELDVLRSSIALYPDFPKSGILFQDCLSIFSAPEHARSCIQLLKKRFQNEEVDAVVGLESRGFIIGAMLAYEMGLPFVPVRKKGKLPGETYCVSYDKEYGQDSFEIAKGALSKGKRVLIVDDLIASGGSAKAGIELVHLAGAEVVAFTSLLEIKGLQGRAGLGVSTFNLID